MATVNQSMVAAVVGAATAAEASCQARISTAVAAASAASPADPSSAFTGLLETPLVWLGFSTAAPGRRMGPAGVGAVRELSIAGIGFDQLNSPELDTLFSCRVTSVSNASAAVNSAPTGVSPGDGANGAPRVVCSLPSWPHPLGQATVQLNYLGNATSTAVPFQGALGGNVLTFVQSYDQATLNHTAMVVTVTGVGFAPGDNLTCGYAAGGVSATVQAVALNTTTIVCDSIPAGRLRLGDGYNVPIMVTVMNPGGAAMAFGGVTGGNVVTLVDSCADGILDGNETDVDCGGAGRCSRCAMSDNCRVPADCDSGLTCEAGQCAVDNVHVPPAARSGLAPLVVQGTTQWSQPARRVTGLVSSTSVVVSQSWGSSLAPNDKVLIISVMAQASNGNINLSSVGNYEFGVVATVAGTSVTLAAPLTKQYDQGNPQHLVLMQRVGEYSSITVTSGGTVAAPWFNTATAGLATAANGGNTGIIAVTIEGSLTMQATAAISADGAGYWGGICNNRNDGGSGGGGGWGRGGGSLGTTNSGYPGNCRQGGGGGGGSVSTSVCNDGRGGLGGSGGGGGDNAPGGGGGHGTPGASGGNGDYSGCSSAGAGAVGRSGNGARQSGNSYGQSAIAGGGGGGDNCGGGGGGTYGSTTLEPQIFFGGSGGGSGIDSCNSQRNGGNGGGIIIIRAANVSASASATISARGTGPWFRSSRVQASSGSSDGGGAGGSVFLVVDGTLDRGTGNSFVNVQGGSGQSAYVWTTQYGGNGGAGRMRVQYGALAGSGQLGTPVPAYGDCGRRYDQC